MSNTNNQNNNKSNKSTGNIALDIGITIITAIGAATVGEVAHRISESRSRKKAKKIAIEENNKAIE